MELVLVEVRLFHIQEVKVLLLALASMPGVFCCQRSQCLALPKYPGDKRAAVIVIPFMFLGKSYIEPGVCHVLMYHCHSAMMLCVFLLQL